MIRFLKNISKLLKRSRGLSATEDLLLLCSKGNFDDKTEIEKATCVIRGSIDWEKFYGLAIRGQVYVLVYNTLKRINEYMDIPEETMLKFKENYLVTNLENSILENELRDVIAEFNKARICCIPLKGIPLSYMLYKNADSRGVSEDIDILIRERDKELAEQILKDLNYQRGFDIEREEFRWQKSFVKDRVCLDLHWDISRTNRAKTRIDTLFQDLQKYKIGDLEFLTFNPETLLIYLSIHLVNSSAFRILKHIADINQLFYIFKERIKWKSLIEKTRDCGACGCLYYSLLMANRIYGLEFPYREFSLLEPNLLKRYFLGIFINPKVTLRHGIRSKIIDRYLHYFMLELVEMKRVRDILGIFRKNLNFLGLVKLFRLMRDSLK